LSGRDSHVKAKHSPYVLVSKLIYIATYEQIKNLNHGEEENK